MLEGSKAETTTIIPIVGGAFQAGTHSELVIVADAGMLSDQPQSPSRFRVSGLQVGRIGQ